MKKILMNIIYGIAWGCTVFVIMGMIAAAFIGNNGSMASLSGSEYIKYAIGSMIIGIGFFLPSLVYENDKLSRGMQVFIHMGTGFMVLIITCFAMKWIPTQYGIWPIVTTILIMAVISAVLWTGFYIYNKKEAEKINRRIKEKQNM